jgi:hypothetical protein
VISSLTCQKHGNSSGNVTKSPACSACVCVQMCARVCQYVRVFCVRVCVHSARLGSTCVCAHLHEVHLPGLLALDLHLAGDYVREFIAVVDLERRLDTHLVLLAALGGPRGPALDLEVLHQLRRGLLDRKLARRVQGPAQQNIRAARARPDQPLAATRPRACR